METKLMHRIMYFFGVFLLVVGVIQLYKGITQAIPVLGMSGGMVWVGFALFFLIAGVLLLVLPGRKARRERRNSKDEETP